MFTARITGRWDGVDVGCGEIGTYRTGGEAWKALKAALAADERLFSGEVFSPGYGRVMFSATNPCPEWVR